MSKQNQDMLNGALFEALEANDLDAVQRALEDGAHVHARSEFYGTPLHAAKTAEIAQLLIQNGADVHAIDGLNRTPLHSVKTAEVAEVLIRNGTDVHAIDGSNRTPLHYLKTADVAEVLIRNGADVHAIDGRNRTPLCYARRVEIAKVLIEKGADANFEDVFKNTPIMIIAQGDNDTEVIKYIASLKDEKGLPVIDINHQNNGDVTVLDFYRNDPVMSQFLLENGAYRCEITNNDLAKIAQDTQSAHGNKDVDQSIIRQLDAMQGINIEVNQNEVNEYFGNLAKFYKGELQELNFGDLKVSRDAFVNIKNDQSLELQTAYEALERINQFPNDANPTLYDGNTVKYTITPDFAKEQLYKALKYLTEKGDIASSADFAQHIKFGVEELNDIMNMYGSDNPSCQTGTLKKFLTQGIAPAVIDREHIDHVDINQVGKANNSVFQDMFNQSIKSLVNQNPDFNDIFADAITNEKQCQRLQNLIIGGAFKEIYKQYPGESFENILKISSEFIGEKLSNQNIAGRYIGNQIMAIQDRQANSSKAIVTGVLKNIIDKDIMPKLQTPNNQNVNAGVTQQNRSKSAEPTVYRGR